MTSDTFSFFFVGFGHHVIYIYVDMVCTKSGKMSLQDLSISEGDFLQGQRRDTGARRLRAVPSLCFAAADTWGVNQQNW